MRFDPCLLKHPDGSALFTSENLKSGCALSIHRADESVQATSPAVDPISPRQRVSSSTSRNFMPPPTNSASYAPMGNGAGTPAMPAGYHAAMNTANPMQSSMPNALAGSSPLSAGPAIVNQTYNGAAPYRPGSVGRPTSYDFSNQSGGAGLPPAGVPNTANGMPNAQQMYR